MAKDFKSLGWDYLTFVAFIAFSILAPLWGRIFGKKKQRSKADYVFATGGVSMIAIMLSIARGTLGIRSVLGYPSELFYRGSAMWETMYGMVNAYPIVCFVFVPVYFNLGITSVYQYLDLRFKSRLVRCLASGTYVVRQICNLGITIYTPSIALSTVIGIPYWISIIAMSIICIFFTIMGGLKAAINADVIQTVTIAALTIAVIIKGSYSSGGPVNVFEVNRDNGRLQFFNFTGDLTVRVDTFSAWLGQLFVSLSQFGCQQNFMQRYVSLKSIKDVKKAMMSNIPIIIMFFSLAWIAGMVVYSTYAMCDPLKEGFIGKQDEILPFFVEDQMAFIPGFLGIFMATLFNGALCMNVSNLNSLATVLWEDFLSQLPQFKGLTDKQQLSVIKVVTVIFGIIIMGVAFCVGLLTGVIESSMLAFSATSGPLLGVFILAMLVPVANWKGAAAGMISSSIIVLWIVFGGLTIDKTKEMLPTTTEGCSNHTFSQEISKPHSLWLLQTEPMVINDTAYPYSTTPVPEIEKTFLHSIYSLSFMFYSFLGTVLTVVIGVIVSYITRDDKENRYDNKLLHPLIFKWSERFPGPKPYFIKEPMPVSTSTVATTTSDMEKKSEKNISHANDVIKASTNIEGYDLRSSSKDKPLPLEVKLTNIPYGSNSTVGSNLTIETKELTANSVPEINQVTSHLDLNSGSYRKITENDLV
ncbi:sodium-coupled monocarboxylate transporter 1 [Episyrphus balteatus]|uniref:sodium-coupled monocarboxylate transporter 1 n=1 Tax=Episyrphus balteatus TaxID=286459 RepID=UPI00248631C8|nr:sodium-coupled monocarboxylate transporter 1 [Episyrphus balteatus]XP_055848719.1 sodium-coupled monocarboxylate transporter 1 [Episyrphus balteatus]XP_055848720.1 sodium-coupled monocarboxylate transporter 1 [Episyrphus balteatus]